MGFNLGLGLGMGSGRRAVAVPYVDKVKAMFGSALIAYWPLDEAAGTAAVDASGNGRNGTHANVTLGQTGIGDGKTCPLYNGSTSLTNTGDLSAALSLNTGTMSVWAKVAGASGWDATAEAKMFMLLAKTNDVGAAIYKNATANQARIESAIPNGITWTYTENSLGWMLWTVTWDSTEGTVKVYRNGVPVGIVTHFTGYAAGTGNGSTLGSYKGYNQYFNGYLAHALYLNRAATQHEVAALYSLTAGPAAEPPAYSGSSAYTTKLATLFGANLIGHWPLNEYQGLLAHDLSATPEDFKYSSTGITYQQTGIGDGLYSVRINPASGEVNAPYTPTIHYNTDEGSVMIWAKAASSGLWTDGQDHYLVIINNGTGTKFGLKKATLNNEVGVYVSSEAWNVCQAAITPTTDWFHLGVTWSKAANKAKVYYNGAQIGTTQTCAGGWASATPHYVEFGHFAGTSRWDGWIAHPVLLDRPATAAEMAQAASVA